MRTVVGVRAEVVPEALTRELRRSVLRPYLPPGAPLPGDDVPTAVHLAVVLDGAAVGTCFVYPEACPWHAEVDGAWHLRQMATAPEQRGRGIGAAVLAGAEAVAREHSAPLLWCHARASAETFYAAYGWTAVGEVFTDERHTIPHRRMQLPLEPGRGPGASTGT